jgi:O-antigen ligase/polysaccharide polymerase Wzy-like membrane protein
VTSNVRSGVAASVRRLYSDLDTGISILVAALLATIAFVGNGGLQLGSSTLVEVWVILVAAAVVAAAVVFVGFAPTVHGGVALTAFAVLGGLTALSILWSLHPADSWVETNRTLAYVAAFAAGIAAVRVARVRWPAVLWGVLLGLLAVSVYGLATKVAPGWLASDEVYARLREPYGYWNAVGITGAMAIPLCLWVGTRDGGRHPWSPLAYPLLSLFVVTMLLSFSRGSIVAAILGVGLWLAIVPLRLRSLALLLPSVLAAGAVTAWAFTVSALTDDRVALADRKSAGVEFGLILVAMIALTLAAGYLIQRRAQERPLSEEARRKAGKAAVAALCALPLLVLVGLAFTDRGIGGTVSDRWHDLTTAQTTPQNSPGRLIETGNVRPIYWSRALDVWQDHRFAGAGAGSFAQTQLRYRKQPAQGRHAHGYVHQTLADLGVLGLAASLAVLAAWLAAAGATLAFGRGRRPSWPRDPAAPDPAWPAERLGLFSLALVAIVFGAHSALDWTWFVPAVAVTGLFAAGWVAGRGPLAAPQDGAAAETGGRPLWAARPALPRGTALRGRSAVALGVVALAVLTSFAVLQPWRSERQGNEALGLVSKGDFPAARAATERAADLDSLSVDPYFERAVVEDTAGNRTAALRALENAVRLEPASPEAWRRLGDYYLNQLSDPAKALPLLKAAVFLDPLSVVNRSAYLVALRAEQVKMIEAERVAAARRRAAAKRKARAQRRATGAPAPRATP